jgi:multiple sugar transport system ATP-binding protein
MHHEPGFRRERVVSEIVLDRVTRRFDGGRVVLDGLDLAADRGEFIVLVGPSGCGKSTTLRLVAGLDDPDEGEVRLAGRPMRGVAPQDRDVAMVFQGYALYPHMTAREIMAFPLKMRRVPAAEQARTVAEAAALLGIEKLLDRRPDQLSGGERQRVAMGRAIVRKPRVFLFDEPLSNLDAALRGDIRLEIGALVRKLGATALYVTHDYVEAMTLADRIAVLHSGKLLQLASPRAIYEEPATSFVGTFLGAPRMNLLAGAASGGTLQFGPFRVPAPTTLPAAVEVGLRPENLRVGPGAGEARGQVVAVEPLGAETHLVIESGGQRLRARLEGFVALERGAEVALGLGSGPIHVFDPAGPRVATLRHG